MGRQKKKNNLPAALRITTSLTSTKRRRRDHGKKSSSALHRHWLNIDTACVCHSKLWFQEKPFFCFYDADTAILSFISTVGNLRGHIFSCFPSSFLLNFWHQDSLI